MNSFKTAKGTELPILNLRGKDYLEVKYRLVWFREEHPDWGIETDLLSVTPTAATARAQIKDTSGRVIATAHKSEDKQGFADFAEKAETGAVGRALALVGYGTQFAEELEEGERIVDSPVEPKKTDNVTPMRTPNPFKSNSGVLCHACGTELALSKSGAGYYCPNFKDTSKGDHLRIKASELESARLAQGDVK